VLRAIGVDETQLVADLDRDAHVEQDAARLDALGEPCGQRQVADRLVVHPVDVGAEARHVRIVLEVAC
jgi:hypothetical protein